MPDFAEGMLFSNIAPRYEHRGGEMEERSVSRHEWYADLWFGVVCSFIQTIRAKNLFVTFPLTSTLAPRMSVSYS